MKRISFDGQNYDFADDITDEEILEFLEKTPRAQPKESPGLADQALEVGKHFSDLGRSALAGVPSSVAGGVGLVRAPLEIVGEIQQGSLDALGVPIKAPVKWLGEQAAEAQGAAEWMAEQIRPDTSEDAPLVSTVKNVPESVVQSLSAAGLARATSKKALKDLGPQAAGIMGGIVGGQAYSEAREEGLDPAESAVFGIAQGMTEMAFELLPIGKLLKDIQGNTGFGKMFMNQLVREVPTEQATTIVQDLNEWAALPSNADKTFQDYLEERPNAALHTLVATVAQSGMTAGIGRAASKLSDYMNEKSQVELLRREEEYKKEVENMAREMGLITDEGGQPLTTGTEHNIEGERKVLPDSIPMYPDVESGAYVNEVLDGVEPVMLPISGEGVRLLEGTIEENIESGEIAFNPELRAELEGNTFSSPETALSIAAQLQLASDGVTTVHQVDQFGRTKSVSLATESIESLMQRLESLKDENGLPVSVPLTEKVPVEDSDTIADEGQLTKAEELRYRILNPVTPERQQRIREKLQRMEQSREMPEHPESIRADELDAVWDGAVEAGTFESDAPEPDADLGGITPEVQSNRSNRYVPEILPPSLRTIEVSSVPEAEGRTLRQVKRQAGTFGIGGNLRNFPREYQEAVVALAERVRQTYMSPDSMLVINFENFAPERDMFGNMKLEEGRPIFNTMGAHFRLSDGTHVITPRELASWDKHKTRYNVLTVNEALYSLSHELGHAVWLNEFFRGVAPENQIVFQNLFAADDVQGIKELLNLLPEAQREVVNEWINLREQVPNQTAQWFVENWLGVRKLALGVGKWSNTLDQNIYAWATRQLAAQGKRFEGASALDLVHALYADPSVSVEESNRLAEQYILSFNEYMAEQFSRHAYQKNLPESVLSKNAFFMRALNALRRFFASLKTLSGENAEKIIKPGEKFTGWIEGLSHLYGNMRAEEAKKLRKKAPKKVVSKAKKTETKPRKKKEPVVKAAPPDEAAQEVAQEAIEASFRKVFPLVRREMPDMYEEVLGLVEAGQFEDANILIQEILGRKVSFDKTYTSKLLKALPVRDSYSMEFLVNFAKQPWVRQGDKNAIADILEEFGTQGRVPFEVVQSRVAVHAVPLKVEDSQEYYGQNFELINLTGVPFTKVFTTENTTWFSHHFDAGRLKTGQYFAHVRGAIESIENRMTMKVVELQSDIMQKFKSKRKAWGEDLERANREFREFEPDAYAKFTGLARDWHYRLLAELNAEAKKLGVSRVRLAHENTMGVVEEWLPKYELGIQQRFILDEVIPQIKDMPVSELAGDGVFTGEVSVTADNFYFEIDTGDGRTMVEGFELLEYAPELFENGVIPSEMSRLRKVWTNRYGVTPSFEGEVDVLELPFGQTKDFEPYVSIYKRHRELRQYAQEVFGATKVVDENGFVWYEYDVTPAMETVLAFDASTPPGQKARNAIETMAKLKNKNINRAMNFTARAKIALTQLNHLAATNPDILPLQIFVKLTQDFGQFKSRLMFRPQQVAKEWMTLGSKQVQKLEDLLRAEHALGEHKTKLVKQGDYYVHVESPEFVDWLKSQGVNVNTEEGRELANMMLKVKNSHQDQFNRLFAVLRDLLWKRYHRDTAVFGEKWREYEGLFIQMRSAPFLPSMQFGNHVLYVQKKLPDESGRMRMQTVFRRHYESAAERDEAYLKLKTHEKPDELVLYRDIEDSQAVSMSLPYDFLQAVADTGNFSQEQITLLQEMLIPMRFEKFRTRWERAIDPTPGASQNLFRNFVAYSWHNANFIAKLKYNSPMNTAIAELRSDIRRLERTVTIDNRERKFAIDKRRLLLNEMREVKTNLMYPAAEFEALRSAISLIYLNFVLKTALMNFTTTLHTIFGGQTEYGDIAGTKAFMKSLSLVKSAWGKPTESGGLSFATIDARIAETTGAEQQYWRNIKYAMDRATHDGVIDQSFAYMLAGMATSGTRMRMYQKRPWTRWIHQGIDAGMIPFRAVEKINRITSLLTFYQLELDKNGGNTQKAYEHAAKRTLELQFDYSKGNRSKVTRGKLSLATIFLSFVQAMGWLMTGGHDRALRRESEARGEDYKGPIVNFTSRMWLTYLLFGGLMGLPFAENIMDLLNFIMKKFFNRPDLEYQLRQFIKETTGHESIVMHGLFHNVPSPLGDVSLSASFGLGRMIPGTDVLGDWMPGNKLPETLGKTFIGATGPAGGLLNSLWDMAAADSAREAFMALPGAFGHVAKSIDSYQNGIMTRAGVRLLRDESGEFVKGDLGLSARIALGFQPGEVTEARMKYGMAYEIAQYYQLRRSMLMRNRNFAYLRSDAEARKAADLDIRRFNESLPKEFQGMRITWKSMNDSLKAYRKNMQRKENFQAPTRQQRGVYGAVNQLYSEQPE